jgi:photosystem II stability/assembly factor-like uncharacterized protein
MRFRWLAVPLVGLTASACAALHPPASSAASGIRMESPIPMPTSAALNAPDANIVWAYVNGDHLFRSIDQGSTWEQRSLPPSNAGTLSFSFTNDREGWALANGSPATQCEQASAVLWHTTDGAQSWMQMSAAGIAAAQCKETISFIDSRTGFMTAWDDNHPPTIYRTSDGGVTWTGSALPDPPDFTSQPGGFTLRARWIKAFGSTLYLDAFGSQDSTIHDRSYVFRSTDAGATWSWLTKIPSPYIVMVTESRWLFLIVAGQSQETSNGGQQWHPFAGDYSQAAPIAPQVVFGDSQIGYATVRGSIQQTRDGGLHWAYIKTPGT